VSDRVSKPEGQSVDSDYQADKVWLLIVQRKLYQWSLENPEGQYRDLWNWVTDLRNLRYAWRTVATNKGKRTPGIDGKTVRSIQQGLGEAKFLERIRHELRCCSYTPSPSRRKLIPKPGTLGGNRELSVMARKGTQSFATGYAKLRVSSVVSRNVVLKRRNTHTLMRNNYRTL